ncbi:glycosyl hydrolase family 28-related protein [Paraburkholderia caffeinilytica]|uniref:glycosyl hydrolase family 28-related protein n=1 Tax=Paraburkholderia caffeinilytica TaxID=1761016 RepID=UPI0038B944D4
MALPASVKRLINFIAAGPASGTDVIYTDQGSGERAMTAAQLATFVQSVFTFFVGAATGLVARTIIAELLDLPVSVKRFGVTGNGASIETALIQAALNSGSSTVYFPPGGYIIDATLSLPETVKKILMAPGATITQTVDLPIYAKAGQLVGSAIAINGAPLTGAVSVSVNPGTYGGLTTDGWIFIHGSNHTPNVTAGSAIACLRKITQVDSVNNVIFFDAALYRDQGSGSTRMYQATLGGKVVFEGGNYTSSLNQTNFMTLFDFQLCYAPDFNGVTLGENGGPGIALAHCVGGSFNDSHIHDLLDDVTNGHTGYGVALRGACRGFNFASGTVTKVRHSITTLSVFPTGGGFPGTFLPTSSAYPDLQGSGEPEACIYGPNVYAYDTTSVAFDTHEQGFGITIMPNAHGCFDGVEMRCSDVSVVGGQLINCRRAGIRSEIPASNPVTGAMTLNHSVRGTTIRNVGVQGVQSYGVLCDAPGAIVNINDIDIRGYQSAGIATTAAGIAVNLNGGTIDGGVASAQDGLQLFDGSSRIHDVIIKNNNNGINNLGGANEYRHVKFIGNTTNVTPATTTDELNGHSVPYDFFTSGRFYVSGGQGSPSTSGSLGNGNFRVSPFFVHQASTFTAIGANVTVAGSSGAVIRLGIYADLNGYPNNLIIDAGTIDGTSATAQQITFGSPVTLAPGLYWIGGAIQGAPTTQPTVTVNGNGLQTVGATSLSAAMSATAGFSQTATGALPATFIAGSNAVGSTLRVALCAQ